MFYVSHREHLMVCILWNYWKFCFPATECSHEFWKLRKVQPFSVAGFWVCSQSRQFLAFKSFSAGEEKSYYTMKGNDNWTPLLRTPDSPSSPAASEDSEPLTSITVFATSLEMQSHLAFDEYSKWHHLSPCHLWGQKQFDAPKIPLLFFWKGSWIVSPIMRENHEVTSAEQ